MDCSIIINNFASVVRPVLFLLTQRLKSVKQFQVACLDADTGLAFGPVGVADGDGYLLSLAEALVPDLVDKARHPGVSGAELVPHLLHFENCRVAVFDRPWNKNAEFPGENFIRCNGWEEIKLQL